MKKFNLNDLVTREELENTGCKYFGKFVDLHIFSCETVGYLVEEVDGKYKVYLSYKIGERK